MASPLLKDQHFQLLRRGTKNNNVDVDVLTLRACLHGGGGHLVGEVTRLGGVKK